MRRRMRGGGLREDEGAYEGGGTLYCLFLCGRMKMGGGWMGGASCVE